MVSGYWPGRLLPSIFSSEGRLLPTHIETAESEAYISFIGVDLAAVIRDFMNIPPVADAVTLTPSPPWRAPGYDWLRDAYRQAVTGEVSVTDALAEAEAKFSQYRQCVIDNDAFDDRVSWKQCAASVR